MKTYGTKFNINYDDAMEMEQIEGTRTAGKIFSKETYLKNITYLKTKKGGGLFSYCWHCLEISPF